ncbi:MAG: hypothetical protein DMD81_23920 [Candidatus Rokuibacteriota bacterium]|nr:MAG: hypothetical protein DMD81_23920 [Candidatus Rokubacteria bacterium]
MRQHGILILATIAVIVLCGCATSRPTRAVASSTETDTRASTLSPDLVGTWSGSFWTIDTGPVGQANGTATLVIHDDGTYELTTTRRGAAQKESGVVTANGGRVTLRRSAGRWITFVRRGDHLYGLHPAATIGYTVKISVDKEPSALASPASDNTRAGAGAGTETHAPQGNEVQGPRSDVRTPRGE